MNNPDVVSLNITLSLVLLALGILGFFMIQILDELKEKNRLLRKKNSKSKIAG